MLYKIKIIGFFKNNTQISVDGIFHCLSVENVFFISKLNGPNVPHVADLVKSRYLFLHN